MYECMYNNREEGQFKSINIHIHEDVLHDILYNIQHNNHLHIHIYVVYTYVHIIHIYVVYTYR